MNYRNLLLLAGLIALLFNQACEEEKKLKSPSTDITFSGKQVNNIFISGENETWFCTDSGLYCKYNDQWYDYSMELPLGVNDIINYNGSFYIATDEVLIKANLSNRYLNVQEEFDLRELCGTGSFVSVLGISPNANLWAGTDNGLCIFDGSEWSREENFNLKSSYSSSFAFSEAAYFIGTLGNYLVHYDPETVDAISGASILIPGFSGDLSEDSVYCTKFHDDGRLWYGTQAGLTRNYGGTRVDSGIFEYFLEGYSVYSIDFSSSGDVFAGTDSGLFILNGMEMTQLTEVDGVPDNHVVSLEVTSNNDVWIGTTRGLAKYSNGDIVIIP